MPPTPLQIGILSVGGLALLLTLIGLASPGWSTQTIESSGQTVELGIGLWKTKAKVSSSGFSTTAEVDTECPNGQEDSEYCRKLEAARTFAMFDFFAGLIGYGLLIFCMFKKTELLPMTAIPLVVAGLFGVISVVVWGDLTSPSGYDLGYAWALMIVGIGGWWITAGLIFFPGKCGGVGQFHLAYLIVAFLALLFTIVGLSTAEWWVADVTGVTFSFGLWKYRQEASGFAFEQEIDGCQWYGTSIIPISSEDCSKFYAAQTFSVLDFAVGAIAYGASAFSMLFMPAMFLLSAVGFIVAGALGVLAIASWGSIEFGPENDFYDFKLGYSFSLMIVGIAFWWIAAGLIFLSGGGAGGGSGGGSGGATRKEGERGDTGSGDKMVKTEGQTEGQTEGTAS